MLVPMLSLKSILYIEIDMKWNSPLILAAKKRIFLQKVFIYDDPLPAQASCATSMRNASLDRDLLVLLGNDRGAW